MYNSYNEVLFVLSFICFAGTSITVIGATFIRGILLIIEDRYPLQQAFIAKLDYRLGVISAITVILMTLSIIAWGVTGTVIDIESALALN